MNDLVLANRASEWRRLKALVLDSVSGRPDTQSETGFRKAPRAIADKTALICGNYKGTVEA